LFIVIVNIKQWQTTASAYEAKKIMKKAKLRYMWQHRRRKVM